MGFGDIIVGLVVLIFSAILHEMAHGYAANWLGDPTARLAGRLTLNPLVHIDAFGSIIFPFILAVTGSPILFGYAKPVPYNPYNLRGPFGLPAQAGEGFVAAAGALTNLGIAIVLGLCVRFMGAGVPESFLSVLSTAVYLNLMLGVFNLIPIPPLDGSKVLGSLLPGVAAYRYREFTNKIELMPGIGFLVIIFFIYIFSGEFYLLLRYLFGLITGAAL